MEGPNPASLVVQTQAGSQRVELAKVTRSEARRGAKRTGWSGQRAGAPGSVAGDDRASRKWRIGSGEVAERAPLQLQMPESGDRSRRPCMYARFRRHRIGEEFAGQ